MNIELARRQLDYWMRKLNLYEHCECLVAAQTNPQLRAVKKNNCVSKHGEVLKRGEEK